MFNCVLSTRRLSVLLDKISFRRTSLPIMYIRSSLPELLAMMHIFFADAADGGLVKPISQTVPSPPTRSTFKTTSTGRKELTDFVSMIAEFIRSNSIGLPHAVVVAQKIGRLKGTLSPEEQKSREGGKNITPNNSRWKPLYIASSLNNGRGGSTERENSSWPLNQWVQIQDLLSEHCSSVTTMDPVQYILESAIDTREIRGATSLSTSRKEYCHVSSVSDSICLIVIEGVGSSKRQTSSHKGVQLFLQQIVPKLCPENILSLDNVMRLKAQTFAATDKQPREVNVTVKDKVQPISLWSESDWSSTHRKEILHSLGLRRKHSPDIAPLKSPYVSRQISKLGPQRKKKNRISRGHIDFFLGPELSHLI